MVQQRRGERGTPVPLSVGGIATSRQVRRDTVIAAVFSRSGDRRSAHGGRTTASARQQATAINDHPHLQRRRGRRQRQGGAACAAPPCW